MTYEVRFVNKLIFPSTSRFKTLTPVTLSTRPVARDSPRAVAVVLVRAQITKLGCRQQQAGEGHLCHVASSAEKALQMGFVTAVNELNRRRSLVQLLLLNYFVLLFAQRMPTKSQAVI